MLQTTGTDMKHHLKNRHHSLMVPIKFLTIKHYGYEYDVGILKRISLNLFASHAYQMFLESGTPKGPLTSRSSR